MHLPLRKLLFWLHLTAALVAGLVILTMAATGLLLAYEAQITSWADREWRRVAPTDGAATPLPLEDLLAGVAAQRGDLPVTALTVRRDPTEAVTLGLGRAGIVYVDPYRGQLVGDGGGSSRVRGFLRTVTDVHRYLAAAGDRRPLGKGITGAANLVFLFVLLSGLYLWVPRVLSRAQLRSVLWFRGRLAPKARDLNWHHVLGIWALVPLVLMVASALPISYVWAGDLVLRITGSAANGEKSASAAGRPATSPATPPRSSGPATPATVTLADLDLTGLDRVVERAAAESPDWRSISLRLPVSADGRVSVTVDRSARRGRPDLRTQLVLDATTGAVVEREIFTDQSLGRRVRSWMRWIHTGEAGGLVGQTLAGLACAATLVLGWTGSALAWRRLLAWRRRAALQTASHSPLRPAAASPRPGSKQRANDRIATTRSLTGDEG